jgi:Mg2+ and Co2+ transporter CorA
MSDKPLTPGILPDLLKAPISRLAIFICVLTLVSCPGTLTIWITRRVEFKTLSPFHLVVMSVAFVLPFIVANAVVVCIAFPLHRWIRRLRRRSSKPAPREAVVAAAAIFAGAIGAVVPAYAPVLAYIIGDVHSLRQMTLVALESQGIPVLALLLIDPSNYWQGIDG